ncbi:Pr6Pr family membrane protein [Microterricola pindariensis]|uniref:Pr6Pr family membrane protein n=1 Tax=Microterricola pindariensis TaxID=478010 RepID=UPI0010571AA1|nr:Pr6Pr family membrane protein [Microterricola pindariensis]
MKILFASLRAIAAVAIVVAIIGQYQHSASLGPVNPFNFFGYFTIQSNLIGAVAFGLSALVIFAGRAQPLWLVYLRALATVLLAIVGIVYNTLLTGAGLEGAFNVQWSNDILHIWIPIYAALDWLLFGDKAKLPFAKLWVMLIYPLVWLAVVLFRGATDGWVPYPFLDPATGYASVAVYCLLIAAVTILFGYAVYALSRVRMLKP